MRNGSEDLVILSRRMQTVFQYLLFCQDEVNNKIRVLTYMLDSLPGDVDRDLFQRLKSVIDNTGSLPAYEFLVTSMDFPYTISPPDRILAFSEAWALVEEETSYRRKLAVSNSLLAVSTKVLTCKQCQVCKKFQCPHYGGGDIKTLLEEVMISLTAVDSCVEDCDISKIYESRQKNSLGFRTFIPEFDECINGLERGTVFTFLGFVGSYKTTFAVNFLHGNIVFGGYNGVFITLEMPKEVLYQHLLSRHSFLDQFQQQCGPFDKSDIQKSLLSSDEYAFMKDVLQPDLRTNPKYGKFKFLERSDFASFDRAGIKARLMSLDFPVDFFIVDYIQRTKYGCDVKLPSNMDPINYYVNTFAELSMDRDLNSEQGLCLLNSQSNREGWKRACLNEGNYDLGALSEANELERVSTYVGSSFTDDELSDSGSAKCQLLKNRLGSPIYQSFLVPVNPKYSAMGERSTITDTHFNSHMDQVAGVTGVVY